MPELNLVLQNLFSPAWQIREKALDELAQSPWPELYQALHKAPEEWRESALLQIYNQYQRWSTQFQAPLLELCWELSPKLRPMILNLWGQFDLQLARNIALWLIERPLGEPGLHQSLELLHRQNHPKAFVKIATLIPLEGLAPELHKTLLQILQISPQKRFLHLMMVEILKEPLSPKAKDFYGILAHWAPKIDLNWKALSKLCHRNEYSSIHADILHIFKSAGQRRLIRYFPLDLFAPGQALYLELCALHAHLGLESSLHALIQALLRTPAGELKQQLFRLLAGTPIHSKAVILRRQIRKYWRAELIELLGQCRLDQDEALMRDISQNAKEFSLQAAALRSLVLLENDEADLFLLSQMQRSEAHALTISAALCEKLSEERNWLYVQLLRSLWPADEGVKQTILGALAHCPANHVFSSDLMEAVEPFLAVTHLRQRIFALEILGQRPGHHTLNTLLELHLEENDLQLKFALEQTLLKKIGPHLQLLDPWQKLSQNHLEHSLELLARAEISILRKCEWLEKWSQNWTVEFKIQTLHQLCLAGNLELAAWWFLDDRELYPALEHTEISQLLSYFAFSAHQGSQAWEKAQKLEPSLLAQVIHWFKHCPPLCKDLLQIWGSCSDPLLKSKIHQCLLAMATGVKHG